MPNRQYFLPPLLPPQLPWLLFLFFLSPSLPSLPPSPLSPSFYFASVRQSNTGSPLNIAVSLSPLESNPEVRDQPQFNSGPGL